MNDKMLAKMKIGNEDKSKVIYMSSVEFANQFTKKLGGRIFYTQDEAVHWSKIGRIGSTWQIGDYIYIQVENAGDDPFIHYKPLKEENVTFSSAPWSGRSDSGSGGSGGCDKGSCGDGCGC
jgi:hypothetical protein